MQQAALLLASHIADIAPELLLHNMMPIFTFASKGVMRNDDEFSVHVVEKVSHIIVMMIIKVQSGLRQLDYGDDYTTSGRVPI